MNYTTIHIVLTLLMMASLITLMVWAWGGRQRKQFDTAAQSPLEADIVLDVLDLSRSHYEFPSPLVGEGQGEGSLNKRSRS